MNSSKLGLGVCFIMWSLLKSWVSVAASEGSDTECALEGLPDVVHRWMELWMMGRWPLNGCVILVHRRLIFATLGFPLLSLLFVDAMVFVVLQILKVCMCLMRWDYGRIYGTMYAPNDECIVCLLLIE